MTTYIRLHTLLGLLWLTAPTLIVPASQAPAEKVTVNVAAQEHAQLKLAVVAVGPGDAELHDVVEQVKHDLSFSGQFDVGVRCVEHVHAKNSITDLADEGYLLALFISTHDRGHAFDWRLYDTAFGSMIKGKHTKKHGTLVRGWAHTIADAVWPELTGQPGCFSSKIAYCKEVNPTGKKRHTNIFVADYDGSNEQRLIKTPTVNLAPRWNADPSNPILFYSEGTNANIRLMHVTMDGRRGIASNFDGINMLPAFSGDGKKVVYCASRGHGTCQLYLYETGNFKRITNNQGNNIAPTMSRDGDYMYFCSDVPSGKPQIMRYEFATATCTPITTSGHNFCPHYHQARGKVVYSKLVKGVAQLFVYDEATKDHKQLTYDACNKDECCWSPCGTHIIFSVEKGASSRLAMLNVRTNEQRFITAANEHCSYPTWSPLYMNFPVITS